MLKDFHRRILLSLAVTRNITQTARELGTSQPAVSTGLRALEKIVGGEVFRHGVRPVTLTPLGKIMLAQFEKLNALELETRALLADIHKGKNPLWRVGSVTSFSSNVNPYYIADLLETSRRIITKQGASREIEALLEREQLDFAVVNTDMTDRGFVCTRLCSERYLPVVPSSLVRPGQTNFAACIGTLRTLPFVYSGAQSFDNIVSHQLLRTIGFESDRVLEVDCFSSMCQLISKGECWGFMTPFGLWVGRDYIKDVTLLKAENVPLRHFYFCRNPQMSEHSESQILKMIFAALSKGFLPRMRKERPDLAGAVVIDARFAAQFGEQ